MANKRNTKITPIEESQYGLYVWEMPDGRWMGDGEGNYLLMASKKDDPQKLAAFRNVAVNFLKNMGLEPVGRPLFLSGRRQVTDEEYQEQQARARAGLVPDPYDSAAIAETARYSKQHG